jgi:PKD repeat protein
VSGGSGNYQYSWYFGDGGTSSSANPYYTYQSSGTYWAELYVQGGGQGAWSNQIEIQVSQSTSPLGSYFTYSPSQTVSTGTYVTITAYGTGGTGSYTYVWGDGATGNSQTFVWYSPGTYSGHVTIYSGSQSTTIDWSEVLTSSGGSYSATLYESGLPYGTQWSVTVGGQTYYSYDSSITVSGLSGSNS